MSKNKLILENSNSNWNADRRYKVNDIVSYGGYDYQNKTGANSDPNLSVDWIKIPYYGVIYPISIIASATGTNQVFIVPFQVGTVLKSRGELYKGTEWTQNNNEVTIIVSVTSGNTLYFKP